MEHFLINSTACLFALWLFYKLALENTSWHYFKRYYLLGALIISVIIPFIVVETVIIPVENSPFGNFATSQTPLLSPAAQTYIEEPTFQIDWTIILICLYGLGVLIMLWRFVKNILSFKILKEDEVQTYGTYELVLRNMMTVPHSFLKHIFVSKKEYLDDKIPDAVLEHEKAHLDQKHSLDILFIEMLLILFWFHPMLYIIRYSIKLNHEFLADHAVIKQGTSTTAYQETLLRYTQESHSAALANTFNFPIIKKRFTIMKTQTSPTSLLLRSLAIIPVLAVLVMSCGQKETKFEELKSNEIEDIQYELGDVEFEETPNNSTDDSKKIVYAAPGEVVTPEIYYQNTTFRLYEKGIQYTDTIIAKNIIFSKKYNDITEEEKEIHGIFMMDEVPGPRKPQKPTTVEMKEYLNAKVFRIWIDGEEVDNSVLSNYKPDDFKDHTGRMFVHKTGRKVHPQAFNVSFYSPEYYQKSNIGKQKKYYPGEYIGQFKSLEKKVGFFKNPTKPNFNLPQKIVAAVAYSNNSAKFFLNNKPFTSTELLTKLKNHPQAKVLLESTKVKNSTVQIRTDQTVSKENLEKVLRLVLEKNNLTWQEDFEKGFNENKSTQKSNSSNKENKTNQSLSQAEQDRKDYNSRMQVLRISIEQKIPVSYLLNEKKSSMKEVNSFITENHDCDIKFNESKRVLHITNRSGSKMTGEELQKIYELLFIDHESKVDHPIYVKVSEESWKLVTVDANVSKGTFDRKGANYTYDSSDLNQIKIFNDKGKLLNEQEYKAIAVGFSVIWFQGEQKYKELLKTPVVMEGLKNGTYAVFYKVGNKSEYTENYEEALKIDASNSFLRMGSTLDGTTINLEPHSWAYTNPSLQQFQKYLKK